MRPCFATLNPPSPPPHTDHRGRYACVEEATCCKAFYQCCCIAARVALPPDNDVPCAIAVCGKFCAGKMPEGETMNRGKVAPAEC
jgi:hypothetical protein